jgi:hypothetical protein
MNKKAGPQRRAIAISQIKVLSFMLERPTQQTQPVFRG